jgi:hypothetical protein
MIHGPTLSMLAYVVRDEDGASGGNERRTNHTACPTDYADGKIFWYNQWRYDRMKSNECCHDGVVMERWLDWYAGVAWSLSL